MKVTYSYQFLRVCGKECRTVAENNKLLAHAKKHLCVKHFAFDLGFFLYSFKFKNICNIYQVFSYFVGGALNLTR